MDSCLFGFVVQIPLVLLSVCAACGDGRSVAIQANAGETVILPCSIGATDELPTVEWSKGKKIAFLYRDGRETHEMKNHVFWYRTNLIMSELKRGNISLRIANLQLSDAGNYSCTTILDKPHEVLMTDLSVGAVSEPKLSIVKSEDGGLTLLCEANCWFPEPEMTFHDEQGKDFDAGNPETKKDLSGCFHVTRRMTVQTHTNRIICRVHQPKINQTRSTETYIPDICTRSCSWTGDMTAWAIIATTAIISIIAIIAISAIIAVTKPFSSADQSTTGTKAGEDCPVEVRTDNSENAMIELLRNIKVLEHPDKDEIVRQLSDKLNLLTRSSAPCQSISDDNPSRSSANVSKPNDLPLNQSLNDKNPQPLASTCSNPPKSGNLPQTTDSKHDSIQPASSPLNQKPSPSVITDDDAVSHSSSSESSIACSNTGSEFQFWPGIAKSKRRSTLSFKCSPRPSLELHEKEESEELLQWEISQEEM